MTQTVIRIMDLPDKPLDAAAEFHRAWLPLAREASRGADLVLAFPRASQEQRGWRLAAVQELAREAAPNRVNGVIGEDSDGRQQAVDWLANSPGITGQLLAVDGKSAEID